jgi:hypothetical protein
MSATELAIDYSAYIKLASDEYAENDMHNRASILKDAASAYTTLLNNHRKLNTPMPCGHLQRYAAPAEDGTQYCVVCALHKARKEIDGLWDVIEQKQVQEHLSTP